MSKPFFHRQRLFAGGWEKTSKFYPNLMTDGETAVLTWYLVAQAGGDVFFDSFAAVSRDCGRTYGSPYPLTMPDTFTNGVRNHVTIISTFYNCTLDKWLIFGMMMHYTAENVCICHHGISLGTPVVAVWNPETGDLAGEFTEIPVPVPYITACPHGQIIELDNGDMLLTHYLTCRDETVSSVVTVRYGWTGDSLSVVQAGAVLHGDGYKRGFCEPSLACLHGRYYLTIRTDEVGLLSESQDGFTFTEPKPWTWDDGEVLENANTMQRWIRFRDSLYLVYTRRDPLNGHIFRRRAPLFITRFDEERKCLVRAQERILVPELGADLGNFSVCDLPNGESILTTAESPMSPYSAQYGSDNSIWQLRLWEPGSEA